MWCYLTAGLFIGLPQSGVRLPVREAGRRFEEGVIAGDLFDDLLQCNERAMLPLPVDAGTHVVGIFRVIVGSPACKE